MECPCYSLGTSPPERARLRNFLQNHEAKSALLFVNRNGRPFSANKLREKQLQAELYADIIAREVVIWGKVKGNVRAKERIEIKKEGTFQGDITTARVMIEDGAYFKGSIEIDTGASTETGGKAFYVDGRRAPRRRRAIGPPLHQPLRVLSRRRLRWTTNVGRVRPWWTVHRQTGSNLSRTSSLNVTD